MDKLNGTFRASRSGKRNSGVNSRDRVNSHAKNRSSAATRCAAHTTSYRKLKDGPCTYLVRELLPCNERKCEVDATVEHTEVCPRLRDLPASARRTTSSSRCRFTSARRGCRSPAAAATQQLEECPPAQLTEVMEAGLPYGERGGIGTERRTQIINSESATPRKESQQ